MLLAFMMLLDDDAATSSYLFISLLLLYIWSQQSSSILPKNISVLGRREKTSHRLFRSFWQKCFIMITACLLKALSKKGAKKLISFIKVTAVRTKKENVFYCNVFNLAFHKKDRRWLQKTIWKLGNFFYHFLNAMTSGVMNERHLSAEGTRTTNFVV